VPKIIKKSTSMKKKKKKKNKRKKKKKKKLEGNCCWLYGYVQFTLSSQNAHSKVFMRVTTSKSNGAIKSKSGKNKL